ncbi:MAG: DnaJ domain-containing protein [Phormidesmis sp.]
MNLARHYQTLGLRRSASLQEVKGAYRQLVRRYHPDINPDEAAIESFIKINDAYTEVSAAMRQVSQGRTDAQVTSDAHRQSPVPSQPPDGDALTLESLKRTLETLGFGKFSAGQYVVSKTEEEGAEIASTDLTADKATPLTSATTIPRPSDPEALLKQDAYRQLRSLLKQQKFPRAIALVEGLAHRMPADLEIIQWQAIVYQRWGRQLIKEGQSEKARIYLKKALRTDPHNQSLWSEVNRDFWQLANLANVSG